MTQNKQILEYLKVNEAITPLEALKFFGSLRLGARIFELRQQGYNIITTPVTKNGKTFASYSLLSKK